MRNIIFSDSFRNNFVHLDKPIQKRILKKLEQLKNPEKISRHLKRNTRFFVEEIGQFRIVFEFIASQKIILIFVGTHKEYEKFFRNLL